MPGINSLAYLYTMETLLISGGSRGIGAAVAKLAIGKYNIAILYKDSKDKAEALLNPSADLQEEAPLPWKQQGWR